MFPHFRPTLHLHASSPPLLASSSYIIKRRRVPAPQHLLPRGQSSASCRAWEVSPASLEKITVSVCSFCSLSFLARTESSDEKYTLSSWFLRHKLSTSVAWLLLLPSDSELFSSCALNFHGNNSLGEGDHLPDNLVPVRALFPPFFHADSLC